MTTFTRWLLWAVTILVILAAGIIASPQWGFLPHRYCLLGNPFVTWAYVVTNAMIMLSYYVVAIVLYTMARQLPHLFFSTPIVYAFALFILACGATHAMDIITVWWPAYYTQVAVLIVCAVGSVGTAIGLFQLEPAIKRFLESRRAPEG